MIVLEKIFFSYPEQVPLFEGFSWEIGRGEAWAVLGPSGCGKTTLLYLLAGLLLPLSGEIRIDGERQHGPRPRTGLILQDYGLLDWATARKNVAIGLEIRRFYGPDGKHVPADENFSTTGRRVDYWLNRLNLAEHQMKYPSQLSGGQRQRVAIARTLALEPDILLMDEPFSSLDAPTRERLQDLTFDLRAEAGLTTVIVTHTIEEAAVLGQRVLVLKQTRGGSPVIVDNPGAGDPGFRHSQRYYRMCSQLRLHLE